MRMIPIWMPSMDSTTSMLELEMWCDTQIREIEANHTPNMVNSKRFNI